MKTVVLGNVQLNLGDIDITKSEPELTKTINTIYNKLGNTGFGLMNLSGALIIAYLFIKANIA